MEFIVRDRLMRKSVVSGCVNGIKSIVFCLKGDPVDEGLFGGHEHRRYYIFGALNSFSHFLFLLICLSFFHVLFGRSLMSF